METVSEECDISGTRWRKRKRGKSEGWLRGKREKWNNLEEIKKQMRPIENL
jgi:hypothetical protein